MLNQSKLTIPNKTKYTIALGGSTISGKTCYLNYCSNKTFSEKSLTTIGINDKTLSPSFNNNIKVKLIDTGRWDERFNHSIRLYLKYGEKYLFSKKINF